MACEIEFTSDFGPLTTIFDGDNSSFLRLRFSSVLHQIPL